MARFNILSIDGGGLRGVVPITILKKVEELTGRPIWQSFDLIAGTSTGGLIASALTIPKSLNSLEAKYSLDGIMRIYLDRGQEIFPLRKNFLSRWYSNIDETLHPRFSDKGIAKVFKDVCGESRLMSSLTDIMICTYDLTNNMPLFFKTRLARSNSDQNILIYDACRATSAGPTYLPAFELYYPNTIRETGEVEDPNRLCIDGGVFVNNPSMAALSEFSKHFKEYGYEAVNNDINYEDVFVLSIGTGTYAGKISADEAKNKGELFWATRISDVMMRGVNKTTDYEMKEMMIEGNYLRLSINIQDEEFSEMSRADAEAANYLINQTNRDVLSNRETMVKLKAFLAKSGLVRENSSAGDNSGPRS